jgi:hypothetical protein
VRRDRVACLLPFDWPWWLVEGRYSDKILQWWRIWGEIPSSLSSTTRTSSSPLQFSADKAASTQPTFSKEASRTSRQSSTAPRHQVIRPRWLGDGQRLQFIAEREPTRTLLLFLGGNVRRTRASGGSDAQILDCLENHCIRDGVYKDRVMGAYTSNRSDATVKRIEQQT